MTSQQFESLYRRIYPLLYKTVYSILRDDEECRDLINETFTELLSNDYSHIDNIDGYLVKAVRNRALSIISKQTTLQRFQKLYPIEMESYNNYDYDRDRLLQQVYNFMDSRLTSQARSAISLVFGQGLSYKEAAQQMNLSVAAINKHVVRTLRLLRENFKCK